MNAPVALLPASCASPRPTTSSSRSIRSSRGRPWKAWRPLPGAARAQDGDDWHRQGQPVLKFGQIIGFASVDIPPGEWVHETQRGDARLRARLSLRGGLRKPEPVLPLAEQATFQGFRRANGKVGTRNYIAILTSVNCSATVARFMAEEINRSPGSSPITPTSTGSFLSFKAAAVRWT